MKRLFILLAIGFSLAPFRAEAQTDDAPKQVQILHSRTLQARKAWGPDVRILRDSVVFSHEGSLMFCDSAYHYSNSNSLRAFGRVHINRGDSVHLYGDTLFYSGNEMLARMIGNVVVHNDSLRLTTPSLYYYMEQDLAVYNSGGMTVNKSDTLRSRMGRYYTSTDLFHFSEDVDVHNDRFRIRCDTLKHNTYTQTSYFLGPTHIISDSNYIYCENGWYNHRRDIAQFGQNARYESKAYRLEGDSLYYDRKRGLGRAYHNVRLRDTAQHVVIYGQLAHYQERNEKAVITDSVLFVQYDAEGDSLYLHADTLMNIKRIQGTDTVAKQFIMAYYGVRTWRHDMQMVCDSLVYLYEDSIIQLHDSPIVWSDAQQLTAAQIDVYTHNRSPDRIEFREMALMASHEMGDYYNQLSGLNMVGYFEDDELSLVEVQKQGKVIYYLEDEGKFSGVNKAESDRIKFFLANKKPDGVLFPQKSTGVIYPMRYLGRSELFLEGFEWHEHIRPQNWRDVYAKPHRQPSPQTPDTKPEAPPLRPPSGQ